MTSGLPWLTPLGIQPRTTKVDKRMRGWSTTVVSGEEMEHQQCQRHNRGRCRALRHRGSLATGGQLRHVTHAHSGSRRTSPGPRARSAQGGNVCSLPLVVGLCRRVPVQSGSAWQRSPQGPLPRRVTSARVTSARSRRGSAILGVIHDDLARRRVLHPRANHAAVVSWLVGHESFRKKVATLPTCWEAHVAHELVVVVDLVEQDHIGAVGTRGHPRALPRLGLLHNADHGLR
mmetsp:Transcript_1909/g.5345  ORF Transcript_1909/g.5345 Transcript_1909/m.5345 type:complete len:232 (-) Transcript_1909:1409-2104(-)